MSGTVPIDQCWSRIGVQGDGSCPELATHGHCRNCPVFARGGAMLLDRAPEAGAREAWAEEAANWGITNARKADDSVFVFRLGGEWLALPMEWIEEAASPRFVHTLPHRRDGVLAGLVNVNGELVPCVDLARVLGVSPAGPNDKVATRRLLVAGSGESRLAFEVDEAHGLLKHIAAEMRRAPSRPAHVKGLIADGARSIGLLDPASLWSALERGIA